MLFGNWIMIGCFLLNTPFSFFDGTGGERNTMIKEGLLKRIRGDNEFSGEFHYYLNR